MLVRQTSCRRSSASIQSAAVRGRAQQRRSYASEARGDEHVHGPGCPCTVQSNKPYYNRGLKNILETARKLETKGQAVFRPIRAKRPKLSPSRLLAPTYSSSASNPAPDTDYAFEMAASNIRYGWGATREVGYDLRDLHAKRVLVVTDPNLASIPGGPVDVVQESLREAGISYKLYSQVKVEPTDSSFKEAIKVAQSEPFDAFVAVGGGSVMDTAKAANLYSTYPADFLDYVNPPIGKGFPPPGPVKPLIAIPTTAGTGSETTGVAIFDLESMNAKTGIAHRVLKPRLGIVDPQNTLTMPNTVAAASGFDVLCHALESWTAIPYDQRVPRPTRPSLRPAYQGSNPISDFWSMKALEMTAKWLPISYEEPTNREAKAQMILASTYAGIGFGNAGVHLCHGMSYPVSGLVKSYKAPNYKGVDGAFIPHGYSVVLHAPAVFKFTASANPDRHLQAAKVLGAKTDNAKPEDAGKLLVDKLLPLMKRLGVPNGLKELGFTKDDFPDLVKGTLPQHRVTKLAPRPAGEKELNQLFENTYSLY